MAENPDTASANEVPVKKANSIDTVHNDEAVVVLANYTGEQTWTDAEEKKLRRKIDWRLMPVLCMTYSLQYYDKAMLGQAAIFGLRTDLDLLVGTRYSWSASIFYLGYIIGSYPAMVLAQKFPVERVASGLVVLWGLCLMLTVVCNSYQGLYAQRFFLGMLESGVSPMFMLIVGSWYQKKEQAMRMGIWYSMTGYVSVVSPLINYGLGQIGGGASTWRYMYYFGASLTLLWGVALFWVLPPDPINAKGFTERERFILVARLRTNNSGVRNTHYKVDQIIELLLDAKFWILFAVSFLSMIANGPISTFIPIIIGGFGYSQLNSLLLMMPCGVYAGSMMLLLSYLASKLKNARSYLILVAELGTILASLLLWLLPLNAKGGLLFAVFTLPSLGAGYAVLMGLSVANMAGYTKRSIASSGIYIGYCLGNFVGPLVFKAEEAPRYASGFIIVVITSIVSGVLIIVYRLLCVWSNKKRDKAGIMEGFEHAYEDDLTDVKSRPWLKSSATGFTTTVANPRGNAQNWFARPATLRKDNSEGYGTCSNCFAASRDCQVYISKRKRHYSNTDASSNGNVPGAGRPATAVYPRSPSVEVDDSIQVTAVAPSQPLSQPQTSLVVSVLPPARPQQQPQHQPPGHERQPSHHTETPQSQRTAEQVTTGRSNPIDVDTGFLHVYGLENQIDAERQELEATLEQSYSLSDAQHQELQQIFAETYIEYCYPWCPVLDIDRLGEDTLRSPLLANALALAGSHIRPPLIPHDGPAAYYKRATSIFYNDEESDGLTTLQAISLFYWWAPRSPALARRHSSWWWTSVLIRHAQQMNFHREPGPNHPLRDVLQLALRRRIWWTAFARERLTALCQSKPCIIDPADCSIQPPTLADFPADAKLQRKGEVFIHWVKLCGIMGKIAKTLSRSSGEGFPDDLRQELVGWVHSLPSHLQLPIGSARTEIFDRDVHQLHLPYLTTIIVMHLRRSAYDLPQALPPAILAASCIVRILRDILSRGDTRFLMPITCWYSGTAFIALLQACRIENIAKDAHEGLDVLTNAIEQLQRMWGSANVVRQGFDRLRKSHAGAGGGGGFRNSQQQQPPDQTTCGNDAVPLNNGDVGGQNQREESFEWPALFPFVTRSTSRIARALLPGTEPGEMPLTRFPSPDNLLFHETFMQDYQGFFDPFDPFLGGGFGDAVANNGLNNFL
ncbi:major facilitator superfamily domain-containing protein [Apodospora peruviana]|uniref:Major facilitator superfamily domain-containing protein n=1 Tax=Apodospora peruviana TaxID=516989 RepID=A0AAE0LY09_9PEZI|nr:major facilitator superfamily domain-containing protein [Apodospora peruviana]